MNNYISAQEIALGQVELGLGFSHFLLLPDAEKTLELTGATSVIGLSSRGTEYADEVAPKYEGGGAKLKLGANYTIANGGIVTVDTYCDGIGFSNMKVCACRPKSTSNFDAFKALSQFLGLFSHPSGRWPNAADWLLLT